MPHQQQRLGGTKAVQGIRGAQRPQRKNPQAVQGQQDAGPPTSRPTNPTGKGGVLGLLSSNLKKGVMAQKKKLGTQNAQANRTLGQQAMRRGVTSKQVRGKRAQLRKA